MKMWLIDSRLSLQRQHLLGMIWPFLTRLSRVRILSCRRSQKKMLILGVRPEIQALAQDGFSELSQIEKYPEEIEKTLNSYGSMN